MIARLAVTSVVSSDRRDPGNVDDRVQVEQLQEPELVGAQTVLLEARAVLLTKPHDPQRGRDGVLRRLDRGPQEEAEPGFPVAIVADGHQAVVVLRPVTLEIGAQIEQRLASTPRWTRET